MRLPLIILGVVGVAALAMPLVAMALHADPGSVDKAWWSLFADYRPVRGINGTGPQPVLTWAGSAPTDQAAAPTAQAAAEAPAVDVGPGKARLGKPPGVILAIGSEDRRGRGGAGALRAARAQEPYAAFHE